MKSPGKGRMTKSLNLEQDLLLTEEDLRYMEKTRFEKPGEVDIGAYIDFLEEIEAINTKRTPVKIYPCDFEL